KAIYGCRSRDLSPGFTSSLVGRKFREQLVDGVNRLRDRTSAGSEAPSDPLQNLACSCQPVCLNPCGQRWWNLFANHPELVLQHLRAWVIEYVARQLEAPFATSVGEQPRQIA